MTANASANRSGFLPPAAALLLAAVILAAAPARAATVVDLAVPDPVPVLPDIIGPGNQPVYITNYGTGGAGGGGTAPADATVAAASLLVEDNAVLHVGYDYANAAAAGITLNVAGGVSIAGDAYLGKTPTPGASGLPGAATGQAITLAAGGDLDVAGGNLAVRAGTAGVPATVTVAGSAAVTDGGSLALYGSDDTGLAALSADTLRVAGGTVALDAYSQLTTLNAAAQAGAGTEMTFAAVVEDKGVIILNGGVPAPADPNAPVPPTPPAPPVFSGLDFAAGTDGMRIFRGGALMAGASGGTLRGAAGQRIQVDHGGLVDASRGGLSVSGVGSIELSGDYLAGYNRPANSILRLEAADSTVNLLPGAGVGMTPELQKALIKQNSLGVGASAILRGGDIVLGDGAPVIASGFGTFTLAVGVDPLDNATALWVSKIDNGVSGSGTAEDMAVFNRNLNHMDRRADVTSGLAENIYNLVAADTPSITAHGPAGELNRAVFAALAEGRDRPVGGGNGVADDGVVELYNGGTHYGAVNVAYNTVSELAEHAGRRVNAESADLSGDGYYGSGSAPAFHSLPERRDSRFWIGGFGRREEANLDYGLAGYKYQPQGVIAGYDREAGDFGFGGAAAYGKGDYQDNAATAGASEIASYSASLYGAYNHWSGLTASAYAAYSRLDNDFADTRGNFSRTADYYSDAWAVGAGIGYEMNPADRLTVTPSAGLTRIGAAAGEHDEYLDGVLAMRVGDMRRASTLLPLDLSVGYDLWSGESSLFRLSANFGYAYDFDTGGMTGSLVYEGLAGSTPAAAANRGADERHRFRFGAGAVYSGSRIDFGARYDYFRRAGQTAHQFKGALGVKF